MTPEQFNSSAPGQVVRSGGAAGEHWAFLPDPLPPDFQLDRELARVVSDAHGALGELAGVARHIPNRQMLIQPFIRREAVLSSRIEGTRAGLAEVYAFEAGQVQEGEQDDVREVTNYVRATEYGIDALSKRPMTVGLLRELHRVLLTGVRGERDRPGEFRDCPVFIGATGRIDEARFVPPPVVHLQSQLDAFDAYLASPHDYPAVVRLALLHYQFEAIHPFRDGNGRIGRLLMTLLLVHWKLLPSPLLYISAFFERDRRAYYDGLLAVSTRGDWRGWIAYVAAGVVEQASDAAVRAKRLQDLQREWRHQLERTSNVPKKLSQVVEDLFQHPYVDRGQIERGLGVSHTTALSALRKLCQLGIVSEVTGRSRGQLYRADAILEILN